MPRNASLLEWLATFEIDGLSSVPGEGEEIYYNLANGYVFARILNQIAPQYFSDEWLSGIKQVPPNGSWLLRASNLRRILRKIHDYAGDIQSPRFKPDAVTPDVAVIAQNFDASQISRLIQLILFCAINSNKQEDYIVKISRLPEEVQLDIRGAIVELMDDNNVGGFDRLSPSSQNVAVHKRGSPLEVARRNSTPSSPNSSPAHSKQSVDPSDDLILKQNHKLQAEVQRLREDLIKMELEKEDYRLESNLLKEDLNKVTAKQDELRERAERAQKLQDELDEQRQMSERALNYESTIENLVKKNNDMKKEMKTIEDKNVSYIQKIVKLEEDINQLSMAVSQVEIYKKQLHDAQVKLSQCARRADASEFELARLREKYQAARADNERLHETTNQLLRANHPPNSTRQSSDPVQVKDENSHQPQQQPSDILTSLTTATTAGSATQVSDLKEIVARLECENEMLQSKLTSKRENEQSVINGLLENANSRCSKLEIENRQARKRIMTLELHLGDLKKAVQSSPSTSNAPTIGTPNYETTSSDNTVTLINRVEELQRLLFQKEQELSELQARYTRQVQKAREVMKSLSNNQTSGSFHPSHMSSASFNSGSLDEASLLRQQLKEREDRLITVETEFFEFKKLKEIHERLILSAFYGLTTPIQRKNVEKRLEQTTLTSPPNTANSSMNNSKNGQ